MRRRVEVLKFVRHEYDPVERCVPPPDKVLDYEAWFETWGLGCVETEQGGFSYSVAVVTRDDGSVETVIPELIRFKPLEGKVGGVFNALTRQTFREAPDGSLVIEVHYLCDEESPE